MMIYAAFNREIQEGKIRPAYLFLGEESFLAESGASILTDKLLAPDEKSMNLSVFYGSDADSLPEALITMPVFGGHKVTIVRHAQELNERNQEAVLSYLTNPPTDGCLILLMKKLDKRKNFYKGLTGKIEHIECNKLRFNQLNIWIKEYISQWNKRLDNEALGRLTAINWPGLHELAGELDRLTLLVGDADVITARDVEEQGASSFAFSRWALTDAIAAGDMKSALSSSENLQFWSIKPMQIIYDLHKLFSGLWMVKWYDQNKKIGIGQKESGLHSFVFKKYLGYSKKISRKAIEDGLQRLLEADLNIKRGIRQPTIEVNMLVIDLARTTGKQAVR